MGLATAAGAGAGAFALLLRLSQDLANAAVGICNMESPRSLALSRLESSIVASEPTMGES